MSVIDRVIHSERVNQARQKITYVSLLSSLPDGVFVSLPEDPTDALLLWREFMYPWQADGYSEGILVSPTQTVTVLTPHSIVNAIRAGYRPSVAVTLCHTKQAFSRKAENGTGGEIV